MSEDRALLFPGQGAQHTGMGAELLQDEEIKSLAASTRAETGIDICWLLTEASDEQLKLTSNAQPALLFMGVALGLLASRHGVEAKAAAGHSVGEYTALCEAGAMSLPEALSLVRARGLAMETASPPGTSGMAAVLGIGPGAVEGALAPVQEVWLANYNTPTQTVIGGTLRALARAEELLLAAGARRVIALQVGGAFHTPLMADAAQTLKGGLAKVRWKAPRHPVVSNVTGAPYASVEEIAPTLARQLSSAVRWVQCIATLEGLGCRRYLELGPKRTLSGMMRELAPASRAEAASTPGALANAEAE